MKRKLPETDKPYYLLIGDPVIYAKAEKLGIAAIYFPEQEIDKELFAAAKANDKNFVCIHYSPSEENDMGNVYKCGGYKEWVVMCNIYEYEFKDKTMLHTPEEAAEQLPKLLDDIERYMVGFGVLTSTDYEGRCGNCHFGIDKNDRY